MGDKLGKVSDKESEQVSDKEESHNKVTRADKVHDKKTISGQGRETQKITHSGTLPLVHKEQSAAEREKGVFIEGGRQEEMRGRGVDQLCEGTLCQNLS